MVYWYFDFYYDIFWYIMKKIWIIWDNSLVAYRSQSNSPPNQIRYISDYKNPETQSSLLLIMRGYFYVLGYLIKYFLFHINTKLFCNIF